MTRKTKYDVGDRVELFPEPIHEGPHPDDFDQLPEYALVRDVQTHPANDEWITGYIVETLEPSFELERSIKPGKIARLAPPIVVHYFDHGTSLAYDATQTSDIIRDGDVLVVDDVHSERDDALVVGVLMGAWPVAITPERGAFHTLADDADITCIGKHDEDRHEYTAANGKRSVYVIPADPGTDYSASVELAKQTHAQLLERIARENA